MWSGPRTVSTALMRAWENRADTVVVDEPLYGVLPGPHRDRSPRPGRDHRQHAQRLARGTRPAHPRAAAGRETILYAKHMTHHLLPEVDRRSLAPLRHAHLIRDPRRLLASYARVRATPTLADLGIAAAGGDLRGVRRAGARLAGPAAQPGADAAGPVRGAGRAVRPAMLSWPPGPRDERRGVGAATGMRACGPRPGSAPTGPRPGRCPRTWPPWPSSAAPTTSGCMPAGSPPAGGPAGDQRTGPVTG